jgi:hypothetical protein
MHTLLIGQIVGVRPITRKDKSTGEVIQSVDVSIQTNLVDNDGYDLPNIETINFPYSMVAKFQTYKGKFVGIPYRFMPTKNGNYLFVDESISFIPFESNPLDIKKKAG